MSRFKTELCNNLIELGTCKYGERCHYAHGAHELRQVVRRHPKYRTEKCKNFELTGKCPFGPRCSYVHPKPDLDSMIEQLNRYVQHTKAPKPDSESDEESVSVFTRTATSTSLYSNCESTSSNSNNTIVDEANKENQLIVTNNLLSPSSTKALKVQDFNRGGKVKFIDDLVSQAEQAPPKSLPLRNSLNDGAQKINQFIDTHKIQDPQQRVAMRAISSNNQQTQQQELRKSTDYLATFSPEQSTIITSPSSYSSSYKNESSDPFEIKNPLSDYFNSGNVTGRNPQLPNKQFYTRF